MQMTHAQLLPMRETIGYVSSWSCNRLRSKVVPMEHEAAARLRNKQMLLPRGDARLQSNKDIFRSNVSDPMDAAHTAVESREIPLT